MKQSCEQPNHSRKKKTKQNKKKQQQQQQQKVYDNQCTTNTTGIHGKLLPLFHDGPIYQTITTPKVQTGTIAAVYNDAEDISFTMACIIVHQVLREVGNATATTTAFNIAEEWKGCSSVTAKNALKSLLVLQEEGPMEVPHVLRTLRSYRSSLLVSSVQEQQREEQRCHLGMARFLLEITLSYGTPISIKRACVSCVDTIATVLLGHGNNGNGSPPPPPSSSLSSDLDNLYISLLASILVITPSTTWSHPITTLYNLVTYYCKEPIINLLYQQPKTLLLQLFLMMDHYMTTSTPLSQRTIQSSHSITTILEEGNAFNPQLQQHLEDVNGRNTATKAVDFALQVTTIIRSILIPLLLRLLPHNNISRSMPCNTTTTTTTTPTSNTILVLQQLVQVLQRLQYSPLTTLLQCRMTPTDNLSILGIAMAQVKLYQWYLRQQQEDLVLHTAGTTPPTTVRRAHSKDYQYHELYHHILSLVQHDSNSSNCCYNKTSPLLPNLHRVALVRGWIAVAPPSLLLFTPSVVEMPDQQQEKAINNEDEDKSNNIIYSNNYTGLLISSSLLFGPIFHYLLDTVLNDPSASVRLSALRGWDSWMSRVLSILTANNIITTAASTYDGTCTTAHDDYDSSARNSKEKLRSVLLRNDCTLPQTITDMILIMWSRPPTRQIAAVLPVVFSTLCNLLQHIDDMKHKIANNCDINITARATIDTNSTYLTLITKRILRQPLNRKVGTGYMMQYTHFFLFLH
jgi:hypothetical protein